MMNRLGNKIASKRKDLGLTQTDFADRLSVTRQTVSRWEAGTVLPDIEKINDIAGILGVSCDYLLNDDIREDDITSSPVSRILQKAKGKTVRLTFFDEEADIDLFDRDCRIADFEGNWMKVESKTKNRQIEKLIPVSSVLSIEIMKEDE